MVPLHLVYSRIHQGMHRVVHGASHAHKRSILAERVERKDQRDRVMNVVQKGELLFAQNDEERVAEFDHFRNAKPVNPELKRSVDHNRLFDTEKVV